MHNRVSITVLLNTGMCFRVMDLDTFFSYYRLHVRGDLVTCMSYAQPSGLRVLDSLSLGSASESVASLPYDSSYIRSPWIYVPGSTDKRLNSLFMEAE